MSTMNPETGEKVRRTPGDMLNGAMNSMAAKGQVADQLAKRRHNVARYGLYLVTSALVARGAVASLSDYQNDGIKGVGTGALHDTRDAIGKSHHTSTASIEPVVVTTIATPETIVASTEVDCTNAVLSAPVAINPGDGRWKVIERANPELAGNDSAAQKIAEFMAVTPDFKNALADLDAKLAHFHAGDTANVANC